MKTRSSDSLLDAEEVKFWSELSVLIAEDETIVATDIEDMLREKGVRMVEETATLQGVRQTLVKGNTLSLVLLDLRLRDGKGDELLPELRQSGVPVIVVTGYPDYRNPTYPVLRKPFLPETLFDLIKTVLRT